MAFSRQCRTFSRVLCDRRPGVLSRHSPSSVLDRRLLGACWFSSIDEAVARAELAKQAHREVQVARRRRREAEDEAVLLKAAEAAGFLAGDASAVDEEQRRRQIIDRFVSAQAEKVMDALAAGHPLQQAVDFTLDVAPSRELPQPLAGDGVFIKDAARGEVPAGTLLTFYPGSVYMPHEVRWLGGQGVILQRAGQPISTHIIGRAGGVIIDGLWSGIEVSSAEISVATGDKATLEAAIDQTDAADEAAREAARRDARTFCTELTSDARGISRGTPVHRGDVQQVRLVNPLAVGEMVNHPPPDRVANVVGWPVDLNLCGDGSSSDRAARARVAPNAFGLRPEGAPAPGAPCPHTVVFVAARPLRPGDELWLDYGCELLDVEDIPLWFTPAKLRGDVEADGLGDPAASQAATIQAELHKWRSVFEATHGRKPNRNDLMADRVAAELFKAFQKARKKQLDDG
eukprot:gnl/TRDRNA2_/TRDRNA2_82639_c0_seq1.p1 gnl/TRDRNA2_/TRDRNA2_82639_c0~~gnl/TRDRNA2_/TRDRNA2_82639_c0_seq1.p1  ORF type:complete len:468 (-),score=97.38 gnl/TRDRNA2_/TRDRNA2_82639_c0_seq1:58-1434(-)